MFYVIAYDIPSDKRREKIATILKDVGGERINYSVFECDLNKEQIKEVQQQIKQIYKKKEDSVIFYRLCLKCQKVNEYWGIGQKEKNQDMVVIY